MARDALKGEGESQTKVENDIDTNEDPCDIESTITDRYEYAKVLKKDSSLDKEHKEHIDDAYDVCNLSTGQKA